MSCAALNNVHQYKLQCIEPNSDSIMVCLHMYTYYHTVNYSVQLYIDCIWHGTRVYHMLRYACSL